MIRTLRSWFKICTVDSSIHFKQKHSPRQSLQNKPILHPKYQPIPETHNFQGLFSVYYKILEFFEDALFTHRKTYFMYRKMIFT